MRYFRHNAQSIDHMLNVVNKKTLDELFASIPPDQRLGRELKLPKALDELSLKRELKVFLQAPDLISFLGAGATEHFVPEWVSQQLMRAEWYTSYTPYQPEVSQGNLQAIFEFQTMVASLFGLDIANASMYDGATALMEALLMAVRIKNIKAVALSKAIHPEYRACVKTYLSFADIRVLEYDFNSQGLTSLPKTPEPVAAYAVSSPNFFGQIEDIKNLSSFAHDHDALLIACVTDMSACAIFSSFGYLGADIAVGEGLGLLGALSMGGPGVGLFASKQAFLRQLPGRLVGQTTDRYGRLGYVLTLAAREQHIRREKATSNICTNHNLMALALAMTWSAYGQQGFRALALTNLNKARLFRKLLKALGVKVLFDGAHYNETVVDLKNQEILKKRLKIAYEHKIIAGLELSNFYPELATCLLVATTELHDNQEIKLLADILGGVYDN